MPTADDPLRADVERALRRVVDATVVVPWKMATWVPRCLLRRLSTVGGGPATVWRTVSDLAREASSPVDATFDGYVTADRPTVTAPDPRPAPSATAPAAPAVSELPIEDYESLAASQVVTRLGRLGAAERRAVREFETAHRARRTILGKLDQLDQLDG